MAGSFQLRLVSPEAEVFKGTVTDVSAPGTEGDFGVRPGHMPLITSLRAGTITVSAPEHAKPLQFQITGGFAEVNATSCLILAEDVKQEF